MGRQTEQKGWLDHGVSENLKDGIGDDNSLLVYHKCIIESVHEPIVWVKYNEKRADKYLLDRATKEAVGKAKSRG